MALNETRAIRRDGSQPLPAFTSREAIGELREREAAVERALSGRLVEVE